MYTSQGKYHYTSITLFQEIVDYQPYPKTLFNTLLYTCSGV